MSEGLQLGRRCHDSLIDRSLGTAHLVSFVLGASVIICAFTFLFLFMLTFLGLILIIVALTLIYIIYLSKSNSEVRRVYYVLPIYNVIVLATRYNSITHSLNHSLTQWQRRNIGSRIRQCLGYLLYYGAKQSYKMDNLSVTVS